MSDGRPSTGRISGAGPGSASPPRQGASSVAGRRPDASMSLLSDLVNNALDPGYGRRPNPPPGGGAALRARRSVSVLLVFALAGLVLAAAAAETSAGAPAAAQARDALIDRVRSDTAAADDLQARVEGLRADVDRARDDALAATAAGSAVQDQLEDLEVVSGVGPVSGPGIKVVVDDAPEESKAAAGTGRVLDTDLQRLLNGLWAADAEAVSVNGQRLTQLTAVRSAGDAILVAYRPLSPPYEVLAVGDPDDLEVDFVDGPGGRWFKTLEGFGIRFSVTQEDDLGLPGAASVTLRHAEPALRGADSDRTNDNGGDR